MNQPPSGPPGWPAPPPYQPAPQIVVQNVVQAGPVMSSGPMATQSTAMGTLGNVLWIFLGGGFFLGLAYAFGALLLCLTIVGIPLGVQVFKLAGYAFLPFNKRVVDRASGVGGAFYMVLNVGWFLFFGVGLALTHLFYALICAVTVVGLPFAYAHLKLALLAIRPFGKDVI
jgi:uncharacterized membrane protein YccF (DUF307 family)